MVAVAKRKDLDSEFGRRLRVLRQQAGLTLEDFADRIGMAWTSVARIERGEREPTWGTAKKLADALGMKLDDFRDPEQPDDEPEPPQRPTGKRK